MGASALTVWSIFTHVGIARREIRSAIWAFCTAARRSMRRPAGQQHRLRSPLADLLLACTVPLAALHLAVFSRLARRSRRGRKGQFSRNINMIRKIAYWYL